MLLLSGESRNTQIQLKLKFRKTPKREEKRKKKDVTDTVKHFAGHIEGDWKADGAEVILFGSYTRTK